MEGNHQYFQFGYDEYERITVQAVMFGDDYLVTYRFSL